MRTYGDGALSAGDIDVVQGKIEHRDRRRDGLSLSHPTVSKVRRRSLTGLAPLHEAARLPVATRELDKERSTPRLDIGIRRVREYQLVRAQTKRRSVCDDVSGLDALARHCRMINCFRGPAARDGDSECRPCHAPNATM